jgi:AcrR family transcriptional regulator
MNIKDEKSTKMKIIESALKLFKERGCANVTVNDICKSLGITRSAFYYHFKSKDEIFDGFFLFPNTYISENLVSILMSSNYLDQFYQIYDIYLESVIDKGYEVLGQVYKRNLDIEGNHLVPRKVEAWDVYVSLIKRAQESGQILNQMPAEQLVDAAIYAGDGISYIWCSAKGQFDIKSETRRIFNALFMVPDKDEQK